MSAFVDEAGTGDEPNIILAALVADVNGWIGFNAEWQQLLNQAGLEYAHCDDMRRSNGPYEGWPVRMKQDFTIRSVQIMKFHCAFGFTISLNKELYKTAYRANFPHKVAPDSAYALCAREVFGHAIQMAERHAGYTGPVNFIFESGHRNSTNAEQAFNELKQHAEPEVRERLGSFSLGEKTKFKPLQAADHIAYMGRRSEPEALRSKSFKTVSQWNREGGLPMPSTDCPIFYFSFDESRLEFHQQQAKILKRLRNWRKRNAS